MHDAKVIPCGWDGGFVCRCMTCDCFHGEHLGHYETQEAALAVKWLHEHETQVLPC